jgi:hypothetical protein
VVTKVGTQENRYIGNVVGNNDCLFTWDKYRGVLGMAENFIPNSERNNVVSIRVDLTDTKVQIESLTLERLMEQYTKK